MGDSKKEKSIDILNGFRQNNQYALSSIYKTVYPKVRLYVLKNNGDEDQAKDIYQEAFVACWKNIKDHKFKEGNVEGYLFTIAKNKWTDFLRSANYRKTVSVDASPHLRMVSEEAPEMDRERKEETDTNAMRSALSQLGNNCQKLLKLFYFERRSMEEIATVMGMAPNSARNQKYRCMKKLRTLSLQIKSNGK
ncbi:MULTISPECIES: RNA polymerase sigma factor [Flavobacteriaceae]|uniref:RNA polymerase sigma factor n=1 Tax=Flavobacteriaceae TaxID=49546 RepID=UPI0014924869|nr:MULTISPECIES: sigma-70 family RNA polymerase sigma factor [Allomuricauda]MDC6366119.1 sigma-70 family RNA polymerase sigma factor [Muricauda sp. AC10]